MYTRKQIVKFALKYNGVKQGSKKHKKIVDKFNSVKPNGEVGNYTCAWCDIFATFLMISAGFTQKTAPMSYNCGKTITLAKKLGLWVEKDSYKPKAGDFVLYDWDDSGVGENEGTPDHIGMVTKVSGKSFEVIEGNKGTTQTCGIREMTINGRYIRGFVVLKKWKTEN